MKTKQCFFKSLTNIEEGKRVMAEINAIADHASKTEERILKKYNVHFNAFAKLVIREQSTGLLISEQSVVNARHDELMAQAEEEYVAETVAMNKLREARLLAIKYGPPILRCFGFLPGGWHGSFARGPRAKPNRLFKPERKALTAERRDYWNAWINSQRAR